MRRCNYILLIFNGVIDTSIHHFHFSFPNKIPETIQWLKLLPSSSP